MSPVALRGALLRTAAFLALATACGPRGPANQAGAPVPRRDVLSGTEIQSRGFSTVLEALQALRPNWLQGHGTDSFRTPSEVKVFLDDNELGGIDQLGLVQLWSIVYVRHYTGIEATQRWGIGHSQGVIYISTHPEDHHPT